MTPTPHQFFESLKWIDGRPLLDTMEPYRLRIFDDAFSLWYNIVLAGRSKKNWKSADLVLAALYSLLIPESAQGNDCLIIANAEDQANDDLALAKKLIAVNADLAEYLEVQARQ